MKIIIQGNESPFESIMLPFNGATRKVLTRKVLTRKVLARKVLLRENPKTPL